MAQRSVSLEWHIGEEGSPWAYRVAGDPPNVRSIDQGCAEQQLVLLILRTAVIGLVGLVLAAGAAQPKWIREQVRADNGIQLALRLEDSAYKSDNHTALGSLMDKEAAGRWQSIWKPANRAADSRGVLTTNNSVGNGTFMDDSTGEELSLELIHIEQVNELIMTEVIVRRRSYGWSGFNPYREVRFYRETNEGWIRTLPDSAFWGAPLVLETEHLRFELSEQDASIVEGQISEWEEIYVALNERLGRNPLAHEAKLTFIVVPEPVRGRGGYGEIFQITSPLLLQTPNYLTRADYFHQSVVSRLTYQVTSDALLESSNGQNYEETIVGRWRTIRRGLRSWLRSEILEPAWPWDQQAEAYFRSKLTQELPITLTDVTAVESIETDYELLLWQTASTVSLIDFIAEAYDTDVHGNDLLHALVQGFKEHRTWDTLLPEVLGVSVKTFEDDWNRWLVEE